MTTDELLKKMHSTQTFKKKHTPLIDISLFSERAYEFYKIQVEKESDVSFNIIKGIIGILNTSSKENCEQWCSLYIKDGSGFINSCDLGTYYCTSVEPSLSFNTDGLTYGSNYESLMTVFLDYSDKHKFMNSIDINQSLITTMLIINELINGLNNGEVSICSAEIDDYISNINATDLFEKFYHHVKENIDLYL